MRLDDGSTPTARIRRLTSDRRQLTSDKCFGLFSYVSIRASTACSVLFLWSSCIRPIRSLNSQQHNSI